MWDEDGPWDIDRKEIITGWEALEAAGNVTTDIETELKIVDDRYWRKAVIGEGDYRTDAMGNRVVDNLAIVAKLKSKYKDGTYKHRLLFGIQIDEVKEKSNIILGKKIKQLIEDGKIEIKGFDEDGKILQDFGKESPKYFFASILDIFSIFFGFWIPGKITCIFD